jgi:hypothetical protein
MVVDSFGESVRFIVFLNKNLETVFIKSKYSINCGQRNKIYDRSKEMFVANIE